ncbi:MAG TPA: FliM/FliN family flagellar motor switch protein [Bryobacteraceae bacterium]|nr:FliM/FliN family flagellar motor switch protein [Bryobacteraceae bacterium]
MESQWIKADFNKVSQWQGAYADQLRLVNETLARDLSMNLSAFLRSSVNVAFTGASNAVFSEFLNDDERSCFAAVLTKQHERKLLVRADYDVLFPLIGIALGAQAGAFAAPSRKPTEIELQVVTLLFRLILSEVFRAWSPLTQTQLEALTVEVEPTPSRVLPGTELMCSVGFDIRVADCTGKLTLAVPAGLFAESQNARQADPELIANPGGSSEQIMELMMSAQVTLDIWLDPSEIRLTELLQLQVGQIIKLDHAADQKVACTLNGKGGFDGQIVSTGSRRGFLIEDWAG